MRAFAARLLSSFEAKIVPRYELSLYGPVAFQGCSLPSVRSPCSFAASQLLAQAGSSFATASRGFASSTPSEQDMFQEVADAFDQIISEAYRLLAQGNLVEAEAILREAAKQAEGAMGPQAIEVSPLYDQLALMQFMTDRCTESAESAKRAWDLVQSFAAEEGSALSRGAAAAAAVRYASTFLATEKPEAAVHILPNAITDLETALEAVATSATADEGDQLQAEKFEIAHAEGIFYSSLCSIAAMVNPNAEDVEHMHPQLHDAIVKMTRLLGEKHPLAACALREHQRVAEVALEAGKGDLAQAFYLQQIRLLQEYDPHGEQVASLMYQTGTLEYCLGKHEEAVKTLEKAVDILKDGADDEEDHLITVKHRLGMALGASGRMDEARTMLAAVAPELIQRLGKGNPVSTELEFMLALLAFKEEGSNGEGRKEQLLNEMANAVQSLRDVGDDHILVKAAARMFEEAQENVLDTR